MIAIVFSLIAALSWGTADIFGGLVAKKIGGYSSALWSYILSLVLTSFYVPFALHQLSNITWESIIWLILLTPLGIIPLMSLYEGIKVGNASLVGTIAGASGGLTVILSVIFLKESVNLIQIISIIAILIGLALSSLDFKSLNFKQMLSDRGVPYALITLITWGVYFAFIKIPINNIGWFWPAYFSWLGFPLVIIFMKIKKIAIEIPKGNKTWSFSVINSLLLAVALFAFNIALSYGQNSIVSPLSSSYPALFAILAYFVFKDRLNKQQILGIIITLGGVISLSLAS